jgi:hypothetical protein
LDQFRLNKKSASTNKIPPYGEIVGDVKKAVYFFVTKLINLKRLIALPPY